MGQARPWESSSGASSGPVQRDSGTPVAAGSWQASDQRRPVCLADLPRPLDHAEHNWPQLAKVQARYHGSFAYITGVLRDGEQVPLFRLRYGGSAHSFGFAIYSAARDRYQDAVLLTGLPIGSPQEALDTACTVHLAGIGHEPPTNLRGRPLKSGGSVGVLPVLSCDS